MAIEEDIYTLFEQWNEEDVSDLIMDPHHYERPSSKINIGRILFVEDDPFVARDYGGILAAYGFSVTYAYSPHEAMEIGELNRHFDAVVFDIRMLHGNYFDPFESAYGSRSGLVLAQHFLTVTSDALFIALTNSKDAHDQAWFEAIDNGRFCSKEDYPPEEFAKFVRRCLLKNFSDVKSFIVHGHDHHAALQLKNYLQNVLGFSEPIILSEKGSAGMTVIEKFEYYASDADVAFALFTPDDSTNSVTSLRRARQNVLFEYGYFLGNLGRKSGKVFLLYKDGVELPSDLTGMIYVNITSGVEAAGEQIRRELSTFLNP